MLEDSKGDDFARAVRRGSGGRVLWHEGTAPKLIAEKWMSRTEAQWMEAAREKRGRMSHMRLQLASAELDAVRDEIFDQGLAAICAKVCRPIARELRDLGLDFRPRASKSNADRPLVLILEMQEYVQIRVTHVKEAAERALRIDSEDSDSWDFAMDSIAGSLIGAMDSVDFLLLEHRLAEKDLWTVAQFLTRHVLGGPADFLKKGTLV